MTNSEKFLLEAEKRFKKISNISHDITTFPLKSNVSNIEINKAKSKEFSEVFTPLWLVDVMIKQAKLTNADVTTLDLCAGYGQFSIRLLRYLFNTVPGFKVGTYLSNNHAFSELQLSSCYKLLNSFGIKINLFIGDSTHLNKLPENAKGIWCYIESYGSWVCLTKTIQKILGMSKVSSEEKFVTAVENLIKNIGEVHAKMTQITLDKIKANSKIRLDYFSKLNAASAGTSMQTVDTPESVIHDMLDCVDDLESKSILVLFNCEIIEQLIYKKKIDPKNIHFATDFGSSSEAKAVQKIYGVDVTLFGDKPAFIFNSFKGKKFDVCFSNPPYNRGLDLKILKSLMVDGTSAKSIAKEFVIVHPSTWLLDQKGKSDLYTSIKTILNRKLRSVKLFNGNVVFGVSLYVPCVITHIDLSYFGQIDVKNFAEKFTADTTENITKFGKMWLPVVKPFMVKIKKEIAKTSHVWSHNTTKILPNKSYCQTAAIRGHENYEESSMVKDDFYTMTIRGSADNKGIRETRLNKPGGKTPTFEFDTDLERDNFLMYLNTDFARFCLSLYKIGQHLENGEMELIPWLDFAQSWDDEKLFKHFDINQETQDYIRKFLPDYYGIRKIDNGNQAKAS